MKDLVFLKINQITFFSAKCFLIKFLDYSASSCFSSGSTPAWSTRLRPPSRSSSTPPSSRRKPTALILAQVKALWHQSYERFTSLYLQACGYKSFLESLVVAIGVKVNPITLFFTFKYQLLRLKSIRRLNLASLMTVSEEKTLAFKSFQIQARKLLIGFGGSWRNQFLSCQVSWMFFRVYKAAFGRWRASFLITFKWHCFCQPFHGAVHVFCS